MKTNVPVELLSRLGIEPSTDDVNGTTDGAGNYIFMNSDKYLAAVLYAGGQQLYQPSPTPFSYYGQGENWFVSPFRLSVPDLQSIVYGYNATIAANITIATYGVNTTANCKVADSITFLENNSSTATLGNCSYTFPIEGWPVPGANDSSAAGYSLWHFANTTQCQNTSNDIAFRSFIYGIYRLAGYTSQDQKQFLVMFCQPTISVAKVNARLSVLPGGGISAIIEPPEVVEIFHPGSNPDNPDVAALLGPPLNGMAVNGYDITEPIELDPDTSRKMRANLTRLILQEGIYGCLLERIGAPDVSDPTSPSTDYCELFYHAFLLAAHELSAPNSWKPNESSSDQRNCCRILSGISQCLCS
jgi:hypothetical protein